MENWNEVSEKTLKILYYDEDLSDREIAEIYGVTTGKVQYKRKKFGISFRNKIFDDFVAQNGELFDQLNASSKERLMNPKNIDGLAKALTHYIFRNGPVEDMHADGKLSEKDMQILNKYMVNRLAGILCALHENRWLQLELLYTYLQNYGKEWDIAEPDLKELDFIWKYNSEDLRQRIFKQQ